MLSFESTMTFFKFYRLISILVSMVFLISCSSGTSPQSLETGVFKKESISADTILTLNTNGSLLLAGTNEGAHSKSLQSFSDEWEASGLQIDSASIVDFVILNDEQVIAAVNYDQVRTTKPTLFKSSNAGVSWEPMEISKPEVLDYFVIQYLEKKPDGSENLFAYIGRIVQSVDGGETWSIIYEGGAFSEFLTISPFDPNQIWTGGWTSFFSSYLAKSDDSGETWTLLNENISFNASATIFDLIIHPEKSSHVLAGLGGGVAPANVIRKSTDGGDSWQTVHEGIFTRTLAYGAQNPESVYASGLNAEGTLFFAVSTDFGDTWQTIEFTDGPAGMQVYDMVSVMVGDKEILYLGTSRGIYRYVFEE